MLAPGTRREVLYRLLTVAGGDALRSLVADDPTRAGISRATRWLQDHPERVVQIEELAAMAHLSPTSFHRQFKQVTGTSPISYHKTVRLHEARRRVVAGEDALAAIAAAVGYRSAAQFSRDYKRAFGPPPSADTPAVQVDGGGYLR